MPNAQTRFHYEKITLFEDEDWVKDTEKIRMGSANLK
jgi:hypothetical protein